MCNGRQGYIGAYWFRCFEERGIDSSVWTPTSTCGCDFGDTSQQTSGLRRDIRDAAVEVLVGFDGVVHLAALSNDPVSDLDPGLTYDINHLAAVRLARLAGRRRTRFVFSSSCSNYGASGSDLLDETAPFNPVAPYGVSKVQAEEGLLELATDDFSPVLLRSATA